MNENYASLYAYITHTPEIKTVTALDGTERAKAALLLGLTCRIPHKGPEGETEAYRWDRILICSFDPEFIHSYIYPTGSGTDTSRIAEKGDLVIIEGTVRYKNKVKSFQCPNCGCVLSYESATVYVEPDFLFICDKNIPEEEASSKLIKAHESSNIIHVSGYVSEEPLFIERDGKESSVLEISVCGDNQTVSQGNIKPWVKVFGKRAREYSEMIHKGSEIFINGSLQTRIQARKLQCPDCKNLYALERADTVLVPYRIEPVKGCVIPEQNMDDY